MARKTLYAVFLILAFGAASGVSRSTKTKIQMVYQEQPNGDYRLFLFGSDRSLVCEEKPIVVVSQGDAVNPVVVECKH